MTDITQIIVRTGTTAQVKAYVGPIGEMVLDTQTLTLYVQDGVTPGGWLPFPGNALVANVNAAIISNATMTSYVIAQDAILANAIIANIATVNANIVTANTATVSYVNTLHASMIGNVNGANAAIISANNYTITANALVTNYVNALNSAMVANVTAINNSSINSNVGVVNYVNNVNSAMIANLNATNAAIITANVGLKGYTDALNLAMIGNVNGANAAIVTANVGMKNYADALNLVMIGNVNGANAAIVTANNAVVSYVNTLNGTTNNSLVSNITTVNGAIIAANSSVVAYVNTLNSAMASNVAGANAAIVTANNAVVAYVNTLNANMAANVTGTNLAIVTANNAVVSYVNTLNSAMASNVAGANAAIVTANNAVVSYIVAQDAILANTIIANTASANGNIVTANNAVVAYVNTLNSAMTANVTGANAAIVTANNAVVAYVNTLTNSLATGANSNVAIYLTTATGNISAGNIIAFKSSFSNGIVATGNIISSTFTDGTVVDYTTGIGRISVGAADTLNIYNGGIGVTQLASFANTGATLTGNILVANITTTGNGFVSTGNLFGVFADGIAVDYTNGTGRISVGAADVLSLYVGGIGSNQIVQFASTGTTISGNTSTANIVTVGNGVVSTGTFFGPYTDGIVTDYTTGTGRISVGASDVLSLYVGGIGSNQIVQFASTGTTIAGNTTTANIVTVGNGLVSTGTFFGPYADGVVVDYLNGAGRISVGLGDTFNIFNNGVATNLLAQFANIGTTLSGNLVTANITTTGNGFVSTGNLFGAFTDGIAVDYVTGNGRISVGTADGLNFYTGGVGSSLAALINSSGITATGNISAGVAFLFSTANVNAAGANQGTATAITADNTFVVGGTGGVVLPFVTIGREISITNNTAQSIVVYPNVGDRIENASVNAGVTVPAYATLGVIAKALGYWWAMQPVYNPGTNMSITQSANGTVTWNLAANVVLANGSVATGNLQAGLFTDGIVSDYVTGTGRISVGAADTINLYTGGVATTQLASFASTGATVTGNITTANIATVGNGVISTGSFFGPAADGIVVDYLTGSGRVSVGAADTINLYTGGVATTQLASFASTGATVTGNVVTANITTAGNGFISTGNVFGPFTDGIVVDYLTGNGRISVGSADSITLYYNGVGNVQMAQFTSNAVSVPGVATTGGTMLWNSTAPTIASGFGTGNAIVSNNGSSTFRVNVGTGGTATAGIVGLPTAVNGWNAQVSILNPTLAQMTVVNATSNVSVTVTNMWMANAVTAPWPASTILMFQATAY